MMVTIGSRHQSTSAKPGPPNDPPKLAPTHKPTPRWLHTLWVIGLIATLLLLLTPSSKSSTTSLTFSEWKTKVDADAVKSASIDQAGKVTGQLNDQSHYQSRIPTALNDNTLAAELTQHKV